MKFLITGGNGMLGRAVGNACQTYGYRFVSFPRTKLDITNESEVLRAFERETPEAVINCAAFTDVDRAELSPEKAWSANEAGVKVLAKSTKNFGARFVTVSTDYVFDGKKGEPYTVFDRPSPLNEYGRSKLAGEIAALAENEESKVVRAGWIFGHGGTNFLSVMSELLAKGKRIKVVKDSIGIPTYAKDLAFALIQIAAASETGMFHLCNSGEGASFYDFARKVCAIEQFPNSNLEGCRDAELARPAKRPADSRLLSNFDSISGSNPLPEWEDSLQLFLSSKD